MAGRQLATLILSDSERTELTSLAARRNTAQALALRARIVLRCATGDKTSRSPPICRLIDDHRRQVAPTFCTGIALMDCAMSRVTRPRLMTPASRRLDRTHARKRTCGCNALEFARHGASLRPARCLPCSGFGAPLDCNRTGWRASSSPPIQTSSPRSAMWSGFMFAAGPCRRRFASTRSRKSRRSTAASPCCRCVQPAGTA